MKTPTLQERLLWGAVPVAAILVIAVVVPLLGAALMPQRTIPPSPPATFATVQPTATATPTVRPPSPTPTPRPTRTPTPTPAATSTPQPTPSQVLLGPQTGDRYLWADGAIVHPHGLVVLAGTAYLVDAGELVAIPLAVGQPAVRLLPPHNTVGGFPVGELLYPALSPDGQAVLVLDKRGDLYRYEPATNTWSVERPIDERHSAPNPVLAAVAAYNGRAYLLDPAYSQVWRHPFGQGVAEGYLPGDESPGSRLGTPYDVSRGIDLAVDGAVYVLLREGRNEAAGLVRFTGTEPGRDKAFADLPLERPTRLYLDAHGDGPLYVIDRDGHRLRVLERESGTVWQTITTEQAEMRAVYAWDGRLYIATPEGLYVYPGSGQVYAVAGAAGPDPSTRPDNAAVLAALPALSPPIANIRFLPARDSLLPGAPRVYRYGIHHGLDMYDSTMGASIPYGTPVRAVADGLVIRADHNYQELTPARWDELAALCAHLHDTPPEIEDLFRGRQVWIDHGNGLVTRYVHLSDIPDDIISGTLVVRGQIIGYVGNSGTSEGAAGTTDGPHLHLDIYLGEHYLGKWLTLWETRRVLERLFFP